MENMHQTIYDLNIDKAMNAIYDGTKNVEYFLSVLKKPLLNVENVQYRQEIMRDFMANPKLLYDIKRIFKRYDTLKSDWKEMSSNVYSFGAAVSMKALLDYTFSNLQVTAKFTKTIFSYYKYIFEALNNYEIKSPGLCYVRSHCEEINNSAALQELLDIAEHFVRYTTDSYEYHVNTILDDSFRIAGCNISDAIDLEEKKRNSNLWKKIKESTRSTKNDPPMVNLGNDIADDGYSILNEGLMRVYAALTDITSCVYDLFHGLSTEMIFYDVALEYVEFLKKNQAKACMPVVLAAEENVYKAKGLFNMLLLQEGIAYDNIVTNALAIHAEDDGLLIRGQNNSGKTTYLRAIGISQVFAQAGLPVCAVSLTASIRTNIFTQFSSAEKEYIIGDTAGRFEGEVQDIAKIIDQLMPHSLLLLNETFQTTSYAEGTVGMHEILKVMPRVKTKYIFVTMLAGLFDRLENSNTVLLESDKYRIRRYQKDSAVDLSV